MAAVSIDLILFAIQAGIKLAQTGRKVYVETTIGGDVDVPLPPAFQNDILTTAKDYALSLTEGDSSQRDHDRYKEFFQEAVNKMNSDSSSERFDGEWLLIHQYLSDVSQGLINSVSPAAVDLASLAAIKQWESGQRPFPSSVQRIAGALVEVGISYFLNVPGALNEESKQGKTVKAFLQGFADVDFDEARWDSIAIALFTTALETFKDHPEMIGGDTQDQSIVRTIVSGISKDVTENLKALKIGDLDAEDRLEHFGQIVLRSLLKNGGTAIIDSPSILGVGRDGEALVQSVGSAFLDILLGDPNTPLTEGLRKVASTDGFDKLIHAALKAATEHPEIFSSDNQAVDIWLKQILTDLYARQAFLDPELFLDIARSALENGMRDLPLLLQGTDSNAALLADVVQRVFGILSVPPTPENRLGIKVQLSRSDLRDLFEGIMIGIASSNRWLCGNPDVQKAAVVLVPLTIDVLSDADGSNLKALIRSGQVSAVIGGVLASEIIKPDNPPDRDKIVAGLNAVLTYVWNNGVSGTDRLLNDEVLLDMLSALAKSGAAEKLFAGNTTQIEAVVKALAPIIQNLRLGSVMAVDKMTESLKALS